MLAHWACISLWVAFLILTPGNPVTRRDRLGRGELDAEAALAEVDDFLSTASAVLADCGGGDGGGGGGQPRSHPCEEHLPAVEESLQHLQTEVRRHREQRSQVS